MKIMKASELRLGNWVEQPNDGVTRVTAVLNDIQIKTETEYVDKYCMPIPLTEEWLVRFGFEEYLCLDGIYGFKLNEYVFINEGQFRMVSFGSEDAMLLRAEIVMVHQLQNLYHALTGEELTIKE